MFLAPQHVRYELINQSNPSQNLTQNSHLVCTYVQRGRNLSALIKLLSPGHACAGLHAKGVLIPRAGHDAYLALQTLRYRSSIYMRLFRFRNCIDMSLLSSSIHMRLAREKYNSARSKARGDGYMCVSIYL